jgi:hypothetical protein
MTIEDRIAAWLKHETSDALVELLCAAEADLRALRMENAQLRTDPCQVLGHILTGIGPALSVEVGTCWLRLYQESESRPAPGKE